MVKEKNLNQAWGAIRSELQEYTFDVIKEYAGLSGIDVTLFASLQQQKNTTKGTLLSEIDREINQLSPEEKSRVLVNIVEIMIKNPYSRKRRERLDKNLKRLGWQFADGKIVPIELLDIRELQDLPEPAASDLIKAATRLRNGDLDGALTSSCSAVESAINKILQEKGIKPQSIDSFQGRYKIALKEKCSMEKLSNELSKLEWSDEEIKRLIDNLKGALNQGANVMQTIRARMGDVHGSKPALEPLVFDSLKWAALMLRMLK